MIRTQMKLIFRTLWKNKAFTFINIAGLAIGMAACLLILQYVSFQLSFDQFNKQIGDIYRVVNDRYQNGKLIQHGTITYSGVGRAMKDYFPAVTDFTRVENSRETVLALGDRRISEDEMIYADPSFFSMFSYHFLAGNPATVLVEPHTMVISASLASKLLGYRVTNYSDLVGKAVKVNNDSQLTRITGVIADPPENSHLPFRLVVSWSTLVAYGWKQADYDFTDSDFWQYILLRHGTDPRTIDAGMAGFSRKYFQGNKISGSVERFYLQPLARAHLYSDMEYEIGKTSSGTVVWGLLLIAIFIILIAWVNYINLATARSLERAREVGVKKVLGSTRSQLIGQFMAESVLVNLVALSLGVFLVLLLQPAFNNLLGQPLSLSYLFTKGLNGYSIPAGIILLVLSGILVSGFYPAFVLSSFKPSQVIKGEYGFTGRGATLRKALVVGQFAITAMLISGSAIVYRQMNFVNDQKLGMNLDQVIAVRSPALTPWDSTFLERANTFKAEAGRLPRVKGVSFANRLPGTEMGRDFDIHRLGGDPGVHLTSRVNLVDENYLKVYQIRLLQGRNFLPTDFHLDFNQIHNILINQQAVRLFGLRSPQNALGKILEDRAENWTVVGVIADFHQKSLRYPLEPLVLIPGYNTNDPISIKVSPIGLGETLKSLKSIYDQVFPGNYFDYSFIDDQFKAQYNDDLLFGKVFGIFAGFAILVACLGLFGLSLYTISRRTREVGIRKVLGASVSRIVLLFSGDFIWLILVANLIAIPVTWLVMTGWLRNYVYRINIGWPLFAIVLGISLIIALSTIGVHAVKAAVANPVRSLRSE
ncbi:MAG TPA: ABC transporter permease [Chitinophagaceae bacterium]|nr:ABC transporter permease [Chitinophagaceae bacterium]